MRSAPCCVVPMLSVLYDVWYRRLPSGLCAACAGFAESLDKLRSLASSAPCSVCKSDDEPQAPRLLTPRGSTPKATLLLLARPCHRLTDEGRWVRRLGYVRVYVGVVRGLEEAFELHSSACLAIRNPGLIGWDCDDFVQ